MSERDLTESDFDAYFEALWGKTPFPWQKALARRLLGEDPDHPQGDWPEAITLPTAAGKTACIDIAVFALAAQALRQERGEPMTAPRRLFFVVDRRVIVDEAFTRANCLAMRLALAQDGILKIVADRLRTLAGGCRKRHRSLPFDPLSPSPLAALGAGSLPAGEGLLRHPLAGDRDERPLACFQLRGGIYRNDAWAHSPIQPTVVCSTVDQIGSRLLFRSYGRSFKGWHLEAGLVGNDALILLDEAHCAQPFLDTLKAVAEKYRPWAERPLALPFCTVVMSATPPPEVIPSPDPQTAEADRKDPVLNRRLEAKKPCRLEIADKAKGKDADKTSRALAQKLVAEAERLVAEYPGQGAGTTETPSTSAPVGTSGPPDSRLEAGAPIKGPASTPPDALGSPAVAIFCNRVATAREVFKQLHKQGRKVELLTGRMRPFDKDEILAGPLALLDATQAETRRLEAPLFVAATQTLEIGANLDFDLMVTECADLSALRQRFGRLNRMGREIPAQGTIVQGAIVVRADQTEEQDDDKADPVYGNALPKTWQWLLKHRDAEGRVDLGVSALEPRLKAEDPKRLKLLTAEVDQAPIMQPAHLDALAQTVPAPSSSPEPSLFLHGPQTGPADVQICWRADLDPKQEFNGGIEERDAAWLDTIALCPPAVGELMPVPIAAFRRWMRGEKPAVDTGDVEGIETDTDESDTTKFHVVRWLGREDAKVTDKPYDIRPGDVIVIPAKLAGWDVLGHKPEESERFPTDRGEEAHLKARARAVLRLHPHVLDKWPEVVADARKKLADLAEEPDQLDNEPDLLADEIEKVLRALSTEIREKQKADGGEQGTVDWLADIAEHLAKDAVSSATPAAAWLLPANGGSPPRNRVPSRISAMRTTRRPPGPCMWSLKIT